MAPIRWVCVSDLHLGALNSVLTSVHPDGDRVDRASASPLLTALCDGLRELVKGEDPPQLLVLGDLFELALCSTSDAAATFAQLIESLRPGSSDAAIAPTIRFLPGNHDHHLWSRARGDAFVDYMATVPRGQKLLPEPNATHLLPQNDAWRIRDRIVELMAAQAETEAAVTVDQSYPNFGLVSASGERAVVLSHGHFVEPLYRGISIINSVFDPQRSTVSKVHDLETENGAWIDFFWSSMGDSGAASGWVRGIYESFQSEDAMLAEVKAIRRAIRGGQGSKARKRIESAVVGGMLMHAVKRSARRERHVSEVLSKNAEKGLISFLSGPVAAQIAEEVGTPRQTSFVFGHTHKPFADLRPSPGISGPVAVYNTGGWVVDTPEAEPNKGAVVVLIDEDLNLAALRCYVQGIGLTYEVRVDGVDDGSVNPLVDDLRSRIDPMRDPWRALGDAATEIEQLRRRQLQYRMDSETAELDEWEHRG